MSLAAFAFREALSAGNFPERLSPRLLVVDRLDTPGDAGSSLQQNRHLVDRLIDVEDLAVDQRYYGALFSLSLDGGDVVWIDVGVDLSRQLNSNELHASSDC